MTSTFENEIGLLGVRRICQHRRVATPTSLDVDDIHLGGNALYRGMSKMALLLVDESLIDLTLLLRGLGGFLLHFRLRALPGVEDKLLEIPSVY